LINSTSEDTRKKFNALKAMYQNIAGPNLISAEDLLNSICQHEQRHKTELFKTRSWFSSLFSLRSSTEKMVDEIKAELNQNKIK